MATKRSQSKTQSKASASAPAMSSGMMAPESPWKWVYVLGALVAGVAGMNIGALSFLNNPIVGWLLLLAGLLVGFLYFDSADVMNFGLRYLIVLAVADASSTFLGVTGMVGGYVSGFVGGFAAFLGPVVLAQVIMHFSKKYFGSMM